MARMGRGRVGALPAQRQTIEGLERFHYGKAKGLSVDILDSYCVNVRISEDAKQNLEGSNWVHGDTRSRGSGKGWAMWLTEVEIGRRASPFRSVHFVMA